MAEKSEDSLKTSTMATAASSRLNADALEFVPFTASHTHARSLSYDGGVPIIAKSQTTSQETTVQDLAVATSAAAEEIRDQSLKTVHDTASQGIHDSALMAVNETASQQTHDQALISMDDVILRNIHDQGLATMNDTTLQRIHDKALMALKILDSRQNIDQTVIAMKGTASQKIHDQSLTTVNDPVSQGIPDMNTSMLDPLWLDDSHEMWNKSKTRASSLSISPDAMEPQTIQSGNENECLASDQPSGERAQEMTTEREVNYEQCWPVVVGSYRAEPTQQYQRHKRRNAMYPVTGNDNPDALLRVPGQRSVTTAYIIPATSADEPFVQTLYPDGRNIIRQPPGSLPTVLETVEESPIFPKISVIAPEELDNVFSESNLDKGKQREDGRMSFRAKLDSAISLNDPNPASTSKVEHSHDSSQHSPSVLGLLDHSNSSTETRISRNTNVLPSPGAPRLSFATLVSSSTQASQNLLRQASAASVIVAPKDHVHPREYSTPTRPSRFQWPSVMQSPAHAAPFHQVLFNETELPHPSNIPTFLTFNQNLTRGTQQSQQNVTSSKYDFMGNNPLQWQDNSGQHTFALGQPAVPELPYHPATDTMYPVNMGQGPSMRYQTLALKGLPTSERALMSDFLPYHEAAKSWSQSPKDFGVMHITNIPYSISKQDIYAFLGSTANIVDPRIGEAIHIIMDRNSGKTMDAYVEFTSHAEALIQVEKHSRSRAFGGRPVKLGNRHVDVEISSQATLMKTLFPKAKNVEWVGQSPVIKKSTEPFNSGFKSFITLEELVSMTRYAEQPHRFGYNYKCQSRTYETMISVLHKYPWFATSLYTIEQRDALHTHLKKQLYALVAALHHEHPPDLSASLLSDLLYAGLNAPAFSERQKWDLCCVVGSGVSGVRISPLTQYWPFKVLARKPNWEEDVVLWYASIFSVWAESQPNFPVYPQEIVSFRPACTMEDVAKKEFEVLTAIIKDVLTTRLPPLLMC